MLGDDGAGSNDDDGPVELGLEVGDHLVGDLAESGKGAEGNAHEEGLALCPVSLGVLNEVRAVEEHLGEVLLQVRVVDLQLQKLLCALVLNVRGLALHRLVEEPYIVLLNDLATGVEHDEP
jgi:hypothetical protein